MITKVSRIPDLSRLKGLFPGAPDEAFKIPAGQVDLLIGNNHRSIQPKGAEEVGELRMVESRFGVGKILTGTDPNIGLGGHCTSHSVTLMRDMVINLPETASVFHAQLKLPSFFEAEELGAAPRPHCVSCKKKLDNCQECSYMGQLLSKKQREVVHQVETSMVLDTKEHKIHLSYPFKPSAYEQKDNRGQAVKVQTNIEKRIIRDKLSVDYNN